MLTRRFHFLICEAQYFDWRVEAVLGRLGGVGGGIALVLRHITGFIFSHDFLNAVHGDIVVFLRSLGGDLTNYILQFEYFVDLVQDLVFTLAECNRMVTFSAEVQARVALIVS
jgi:hypothetical protein